MVEAHGNVDGERIRTKRRKTAHAEKEAALPPRWAEFAERLAAALAVLEDEQFLLLETKRGHRYLQFACQGGSGFQGEAVSNAVLTGGDRLDEETVARIIALGWQPPAAPSEGEPSTDGGGPNFWRDWPRPVPPAEIALLAGRTLYEGYRIASPVNLRYHAFAYNGGELLIPTLGLSRAAARTQGHGTHGAAGGQLLPLHHEVSDFLARFTGITELTFDGDGDIPLRHGSAMIFVRVHEQPPMIELFSPVLRDVTHEAGLVEALNELNSRTRFVSFSAIGGGVVASHELFAQPFVPDHLGHALAVLSRTADEADDELQARFGGEVFFADDGTSKPPRRTIGPN